MAVNTTKVKGSLRDFEGNPYEGALVKVYLANPMKYSDNIIGNQSISVFTNSYGVFEVNLIPSESDELNSDNYYIFEITEETTFVYRKIVPVSSATLEFEDLEDYVLPSQRTLYIGRGNDSSPVSSSQIQVDLTGIFKWTTFDGDGTTKSFTAPGSVYIVSLDGILLIEGIDYEKTRYDTVALDEAPESGNILAIQYKI